ncbi:MAG: hypothetical protein HYS07_04365 [Chlamydiae bacterium]|nr:hypothetical protein [Chlamydiota bacterium]MBI3277433.1 hypothetical protein [Chlamydiota bacterium]
MSKKWVSTIALSLFLLTVSHGFSEQVFGVDLPPGATPDETLTNLSKESADKMQAGVPEASRIKFEQKVYTTKDSFNDVLAYYEKIFGMKAQAFDPKNPSGLGPEGFALRQEVDMKEVASSAKLFNDKLDATKYEGKVQLALFNKPKLPMVQIVDQGLNWQDGSVIKSTIIGITKQPELPALQTQSAAPSPVTTDTAAK